MYLGRAIVVRYTACLNMAENTIPSEEVVVPIPEEKSEVKEQPAKELPNATTIITTTSRRTSRRKAAKTDKMKLIVLPLTLLSFLLSLPILFSVVWLLYMSQYDCENLLHLPKLQLGIVIGLIIVFFVSNFVLKFRTRFPMPGLLLIMMPLILMLVVGLGLVGAFNMDTRIIPGTPKWLKMKVDDDYNWSNIKSCIYDTTTCRELVLRSYEIKSYYITRSKLSSIESGCCVPPSSCEMEYLNATFWRKRDGAINISNPLDRDCDLWQNDETIFCYDCQACKEGYLKPLRGKWRKLGTFLIVMSVLLSVSHLLLFISTMLEQLSG